LIFEVPQPDCRLCQIADSLLIEISIVRDPRVALRHALAVTLRELPSNDLAVCFVKLEG